MKLKLSAPTLFLLISAMIAIFQLQAPMREVKEEVGAATQASAGTDLVGSTYQFLIFETDTALPSPVLVQQEQNQMNQGQEQGGQQAQPAEQQNQQVGPDQQAQPPPAAGQYGGWGWAWWWWIVIAIIILFFIILFAVWGGKSGGGTGAPPEDRL